MHTTIEKSVDVAVPVRRVYNQWTQFESFPQFMEGVEEIQQITDTLVHWRTKIAGVQREFDAEITEQHPDQRVAWHTLDGPHQAGVVTFHRLDDTHTRVMLQLEYHPDSLVEKAGTALGMVQRRAEGDLQRFKEFIESRGVETGAWRGDVARSPQQGESGHDPVTRSTSVTGTSVTGTSVTGGTQAPVTGGAVHADPFTSGGRSGS